jgi:hypothetical protein
VQLARQRELEGYRALIAGRFPEARSAFEDSEKALPGYHHSYEIARLLKKNEKNLGDPSVQKQILNTVVKDYYGYIPSDMLNEMKLKLVNE